MMWGVLLGGEQRLQLRRGLFACGDEDKGEKGEGMSEGSGGWSAKQGQVKLTRGSQMAAARRF